MAGATNKPPRILIIEDEESIADSLGYTLQHEGYEVDIAYNGPEGLQRAAEFQPDLVLLDLMLPDMDGLEVCQELRNESAAAVIMVTGKAAEADRIIGLELGADDYIIKPYNLREVVARVRAVLRRRPRRPPPGEDLLAAADLVLDLRAREALQQGERLELTRLEFELLRIVLAHAGRVVSRDDLLQEVWGDEVDRDPHALEVLVSRLREKIEPDPQQPRRLLTVRGVGYKFVSGE